MIYLLSHLYYYYYYYFSIRIDSEKRVAGQYATIAIVAYEKIEDKSQFMVRVVPC
jgi:hypothetical protein